MFGVDTLQIDILTASPVLTTLALLALVGAALYLYYRTNPPVPKFQRILLGTLRTIAVIALVIALFETVIGYTRDYERKPRVAVLIDRSDSMEKKEGNESRKEKLDSLLSTPAFDELRERAEVIPYYFAGSLDESESDIQKDRTALGDAFEDLRNRRLDAPADYWLVMSDGRSNSGRDPLATVDAIRNPILAVNISDQAKSFDVGIQGVDFNPVVYSGKSTEVKVHLSAQGMASRTITVELRDDKETLASRQVQISQDDGRADVTLNYTPREPGESIVRVRIPSQGEEENDANNQSSFAVTVLKSKLQILIVSTHPDYEIGFLRQTLVKSDKYEVTVIVPSGKAGNLAGNLPRTPAEWNRYDLVVLDDPSASTFSSQKESIQTFMAEHGGGLWLMMGESFGFSVLDEWTKQILPFYPMRQNLPSYVELYGAPVEGNLFHPVVRLGEDQTETRQLWSQLPPLRMVIPCDTVNPDATVLATAGLSGRPESSMPIIGFRRVGAGKLFATAAQPFWQWGFGQAGYGGHDDLYQRFIDGTISWLTTREDLEPVRIAPERTIYKRGEAVRFSGAAFDLGFRPLTGVTGTVSLQKDGENSEREQDLLPLGEGAYASEFANLAPGRYKYLAHFEKDGQLIKQTQGKLEVEPFSLEEQDMSDGIATLQAVASRTGGQYYSWREFGKAVEGIRTVPIVEHLSAEIPVWSKGWLLMLFVLLLSVEWAIRKSKGLL